MDGVKGMLGMLGRNGCYCGVIDINLPGMKVEIQMELPFPVTRDQICLMCHWASGCGKCCKKCKDQCNACQECALNDDQEVLISRWQAVYGIINDFKDYERTKSI